MQRIDAQQSVIVELTKTVLTCKEVNVTYFVNTFEQFYWCICHESVKQCKGYFENQQKTRYRAFT